MGTDPAMIPDFDTHGFVGEKPTVVDSPARLVTVEKNSGTPDIRKFDVGSINSAIDRTLRMLPEDKRVAAIAYVDKNGANVALVGKIKKVPGDMEWTVMGTREWSGDWNASAALRWSI